MRSVPRNSQMKIITFHTICQLVSISFSSVDSQGLKTASRQQGVCSCQETRLTGSWPDKLAEFHHTTRNFERFFISLSLFCHNCKMNRILNCILADLTTMILHIIAPLFIRSKNLYFHLLKGPCSPMLFLAPAEHRSTVGRNVDSRPRLRCKSFHL